MTQRIVDLVGMIRSAQRAAPGDDSSEWGALADALAIYEAYPLQSLTSKLGQVVLKKPAQRAPRAAPPRAARPRIGAEDRKKALETHTGILRSALHDDGAFVTAFMKAKDDPAFDARTALKLFENVIGTVNFSVDPLRKPTVFKQIREQRNTIVHRRERTGQFPR